MSNNSWKQFGGISKTDNFNTINASTIIADQFISRSTRPTYQFLNGTFEVSLDLSSGVNILAGNSIYTGNDIFVNRDVYTNNKLFFGNNTFQNTGNNFPALAGNSTHAYLYGNSSNIGVNTLLPKTVFNITGTVPSVTDILTVESGNVYIRNIIAQNVNKRGVVVDADDVSSNIYFYNDVATDKSNVPDATIKFQDGGILTTRTTNRIINSSRTSQIDTSGGRLLMDASGTVLTSSGYLSMDISGEIQFKTKRGYLLNTSGGMIKLDQTTGNMQIDVSNDFILNCSGGAFLLNDDSTQIRTVGNITLLSTGRTGLGGSIVFDSSGGNIDFNSGDIKLNTLLKFAPPGRGVSNELIHDETLSIYDNSYRQFLPNVYNDSSILTGNAATFIGKDPKANSFIFMNPATNKLGSAFGGGMVPYDVSRAMAMVGLTDSSGQYVHSQMTVSSTNKHKYPSTLGINTYRPRTEEYVLDVNGPMHLGNGEINTVAENSYEIKHMNFSKTNLDYGIAVGSPSTKSGLDTSLNIVIAMYKQYLLYTRNGGKTWAKSDILAPGSFNENEITIINHVHVFDTSYSAIAANNGYMFLSNNSGISWYRLQIPNKTGYTDNIFQTITIVNTGNTTTPHRIVIAYKATSTSTKTTGIYFIDCNLTTIFNTAINFVININASEVNVGINLVPGGANTFNIISANATNSYLYYAGDFGLARYKYSDLVDGSTTTYTDAQIYTLLTDTSNNQYNKYKSIYAYDDSRAIAVGTNIISYTTIGTSSGWTHKTNVQLGLPSMTLNSVFIYDLSNAVSVGLSGEFIYSTDWSSGIWQRVPEKLLNSSGMRDRIRGTENNLKSISMPDINTMIIADATASFIPDPSGNFNNTTLGYSKMQYGFLPNLFNRTNNTVLDVSGNMVISGDVEIFDGELLVSTIDYKPQNAADVSGTMNFGTKTHVVNIGKTDERSLIETAINRMFDTCDSVINIGVTDPLLYDSSTVIINVGNYSQSTFNRRPNKINIGGGNDLVSFGGTLIYSSTQITSSKNKGFQINDLNLNDGIVQYMSTNSLTNANLSTGSNPSSNLSGVVLNTSTNNYTYTGTIDASNATTNLEIFLRDVYKPFKSGKEAGIRVTDNLDRNAGYFIVSQDMSGWVMKPTNPGSNSLKIDVNSLMLRTLETSPDADISYGVHNILNGIVVLTRTIGQTDSNYSLTVKQLDISNIMVRDSEDSSTTQQVINTKLLVKDDVVIKQGLIVDKDVTLQSRLFAVNDVTMNSRLFVLNDVSLSQRLYVRGDASFNGNVDISGVLRATYHQNNFIINTVTNNYEFIITTDMSMSGNLFVNGDTSLNGIVDISGRVAIGKRNPVVALDISYTDAIRIPKGTTAQRPDTSGGAISHGGYIRYNNENQQFEGYGPGNSWGSLGGVINVAQNTKIIASSPNADSSNNDLMFFTARRWDISTNNSLERMRIDGSGNVGIGTTRPLCTLHVDISNNPEQTFWTSMMTHTSLKSRKNADLERFSYETYPAYDFKVVDATQVNSIVAAYIIYRRDTPLKLFANYLPFGVTDDPDTPGTDYRYEFDGTNLDLENFVKTNLSNLIQTYPGLPTMIGNIGSGVTETSGIYNYNFTANNFNIEYHFIQKYIALRRFGNDTTDTITDTGLPYGVTGTSGNYKYDFVRSIGSAIGKNTTGLNNSAEIKYWHIDDLSTSNALSFGFNQNSNKIFIRADGRTGIGTINPRSCVDISYTDALIIPSGTASERPLVEGETRGTFTHKAVTGMIRYNKTNSQFEGFGPGNSWGSLGGVINVAQNTKIIASSPNADSSNNDLMFFTAVAGDTSMNAGIERMRITSGGDVSMNFRLFVGGDVSLNRRLYVGSNSIMGGDVSMNFKLIVGGDVSLNSKLIVGGDVSMNSKLIVGGDVSLNSKLIVGGDVSMNSKLIVGGDVSLNTRLYVGSNSIMGGDVSMNSRLSVGGDVSLNNRLYVGSTVNATGKVNCAGINSTGIIYSTGYIGIGIAEPLGSIHTTGNIVCSGLSSNQTIFASGLDLTNYPGSNISAVNITTSTVNVSTKSIMAGDVSMNSRLFVGGDLSLNGSLYMQNNLYMNNGYVLYAKNTAGVYQSVFIPRGSYDNTTYLTFGTGGFNIRNSSDIPTMFMSSIGNVGIGTGTESPPNRLDVSGNARIKGTGTLLRLENNTTVYGGGSANIEFWSASNNNPLGMIKTTDIGVAPSSAYKSKMEFFVNLDSTSADSLRIALKLDSTGVEATSYNATSDYRIKDNLISLPDCSFVVDPLRPVYYRNKLTNKQDIGLIAHEVQEHFPFLVNGEKDGEHNQSVNYTGFISLLIHEIQQLKRRVFDLENQAATIDNELGYKQKSIHYDGLFPHLIESIKTLSQENKDLVSKVDVLTQENKALSTKVDKIMTILDKLNISV